MLLWLLYQSLRWNLCVGASSLRGTLSFTVTAPDQTLELCTAHSDHSIKDLKQFDLLVCVIQSWGKIRTTMALSHHLATTSHCAEEKWSWSIRYVARLNSYLLQSPVHPCNLSFSLLLTVYLKPALQQLLPITVSWSILEDHKMNWKNYLLRIY